MPGIDVETLEPKEVPGLILELDFIDEEQQQELLSVIKNDPAWTDGKGRRAIHFGYTFDYKSMGIDTSIPFRPFPDWLRRVLPKNEIREPDQICIQHYSPGTGIPPHVDTHSVYDQLYGLSLGSSCFMQFRREGVYIDVDMPPRSMMQMTGDSRLHWTHTIKKRKTDQIGDITRPREHRYSITYRWLRVPNTTGLRECECQNLLLCDTALSRAGRQKEFRWKEELQSQSSCIL